VPPPSAGAPAPAPVVPPRLAAPPAAAPPALHVVPEPAPPAELPAPSSNPSTPDHGHEPSGAIKQSEDYGGYAAPVNDHRG
jgi:hypothetical protein